MMQIQIDSSSFLYICLELYKLVQDINEETIHPLLWDIIQGESGLKTKVHQFLTQSQPPTYTKMFLVSPDVRQ